MEYIKYLPQVAIVFTTLTLIVGHKQYRSYLWWYMFASLMADCITTYILMPYGFNRGWPANLFMLSEFVFLSLYIKQFINAKKLFGVFIIVGFTVLCWRIVSQSVLNFNIRDMWILHLIYLAYGFTGFYILLKAEQPKPLETQAYFWVNVMFILYYSGIFVLFLFTQYLVKEDREALKILWPVVLSSLNILQRILLAIAFTRKDYK